MVCSRLQRWLWRKHGRSFAQWSTYTAEVLHERFDLYRMPGAVERKPSR